MGVNCIDYSTLTVSSTALLLRTSAAPDMPSRAKGAVITVEDDQVRYRDDGTDPASDEGHLLNVGDVLTFDSWSVPKQNWRPVLQTIKFISVTTDAKLKISWYD